MARYQMKPGMGRHGYIRNGKNIIVKPGDIIDVEEYELRAAADKFERLDPPAPEPEPARGLYPEHAGAGRWNVINPATGKPINNELLSKEEAQSLANKGVDEEDDASPDNGQPAAAGTDNQG